MISEFKIDGLSVEFEPSITKWGYQHLDDAPDLHRWRASWAPSDMDNVVGGIMLAAYPVIKSTKCGAWINKDGYLSGNVWEEFDEKWMRKVFVHNNSNKSWVKPTQDEAIRSLAVRLDRWATHVRRDVERIRGAADVLARLRPDLESFSAKAVWRVEV